MTTTSPSRPTTHGAGRWTKPTTVALLLWGLLHVVGGTILMITAAADPLAALQSLGSAAPAADLPLDPGPVTGAVIGFHGLNILWAGLAVTVLSVRWSWRSYPKGVPTSLLIAGAADIGLIGYLLIPGFMRLSEGVWGPLLLAIAASGAALARRDAMPVTRSQMAPTNHQEGQPT